MMAQRDAILCRLAPPLSMRPIRRRGDREDRRGARGPARRIQGRSGGRRADRAHDLRVREHTGRSPARRRERSRAARGRPAASGDDRSAAHALRARPSIRRSRPHRDHPPRRLLRSCAARCRGRRRGLTPCGGVDGEGAEVLVRVGSSNRRASEAVVAAIGTPATRGASRLPARRRRSCGAAADGAGRASRSAFAAAPPWESREPGRRSRDSNAPAASSPTASAGGGLDPRPSVARPSIHERRVEASLPRAIEARAALRDAQRGA